MPAYRNSWKRLPLHLQELSFDSTENQVLSQCSPTFRVVRRNRLHGGLTASPDTLHEICQPKPLSSVARHLAREKHRDSKLSLTAVNAVLASLMDNQARFDDSGSPMDLDSPLSFHSFTDESDDLVTAEDFQPAKIEHIPGVNDCMTGALPHDSSGPNLPDNDKLDCSKDWEEQFKSMPFRILSSRSLAEYPNLFFNSRDRMEMLGDHFVTTNDGLRRAVMECQQMQCKDETTSDAIMLGALARRGGRFPTDSEGCRVMYPEDMQPLLVNNTRLCDVPYWCELYAQGEVWNEMPVSPRKEAPAQRHM